MAKVEEPIASQVSVTEPTEIVSTVPSQSDLFKDIGERLGVGARKGGVDRTPPLET